ncbi:hypothetical protein G3I19_08805 [Streptomyces sp. SID10853]|uniref:hypothetical protein n=1 Tax=Streptomyces sp. SID10853 TaxID=2706028 RepID=UPI0013C09314|nr:hypothetical protein [Streptomyces sp. SID10853]NDZ78622.1 hypothetical protein [Streptomyces sp. SID10853]
MTQRTLLLFEDTLPAGAKPVYLPAGARAVYVRSGSVDVIGDDGSRFLWEGAALVAGKEATLAAGDEDTVLWRWELADGDADERDFRFRSAPEADSTLKLRAAFDFDDRYTWLMRCDTVRFPAGGTALTHLHQGPGIRVVLDGEITIETEGTSATHLPGDAWAEQGVLPVRAPTTERRPTTFVRCFLLPKQNKGVSSIRIVEPEDRAKPNTQKYRVLAEQVLASGT